MLLNITPLKSFNNFICSQRQDGHSVIRNNQSFSEVFIQCTHNDYVYYMDVIEKVMLMLQFKNPIVIVEYDKQTLLEELYR